MPRFKLHYGNIVSSLINVIKIIIFCCEFSLLLSLCHVVCLDFIFHSLQTVAETKSKLTYMESDKGFTVSSLHKSSRSVEL